MDIEKWWSGLKVTEKERIAEKILEKNPDMKGDPTYPGCTILWEALDEKTKEFIRQHCIFKHGYLDKVDFAGDPLTD